jgi:PAS domain-containing protein
VAAVGLRLLLGETTRLIFVTFYPAVMASAWWGGRGPAMLAMALCALAADYGWLSPRGSLFPSTPQEWTDLFLFTVVAGALGIVTARLRDVQVRLHSLLEKTSDGFAIIDRSWRYRYVNPRFAAMVRKQPRELLGRRVWDVFPDSRDTIFAKWTACQATRPNSTGPWVRALTPRYIPSARASPSSHVT